MGRVCAESLPCLNQGLFSACAGPEYHPLLMLVLPMYFFLMPATAVKTITKMVEPYEKSCDFRQGSQADCYAATTCNFYFMQIVACISINAFAICPPVEARFGFLVYWTQLRMWEYTFISEFTIASLTSNLLSSYFFWRSFCCIDLMLQQSSLFRTLLFNAFVVDGLTSNLLLTPETEEAIPCEYPVLRCRKATKKN